MTTATVTTDTDAAPVNTLLKKKIAAKGKGKADKKKGQQAVAFLNWSIPLTGGKEFKSGKGLPIFQNPEYPNPQEDKLIELAKSKGGVVELTMKVRIVLNNAAALPDLKEFVLG